MTFSSPLSAPARFQQIMNVLGTSVVSRFPWIGDTRGMAICGYLCLLGHRFRVLVAQIRAGKVPPERPRTARAPEAADTGRVARAAEASALFKAPRRFRWLVELVPDALNSGNYLVQLLEDPEMAALVWASPGLRRLLRSMCRMLGVSPLPELIRLPPRVRRRAARPDDHCVGLTERHSVGVSPPTVSTEEVPTEEGPTEEGPTEDDGLKPTRRSTSRSDRRLGRLPELGSSAWLAAMRCHAGDGFSSA